MGFFSKIFGAKAEKEALDLLKTISGGKNTSASKPAAQEQKSVTPTQNEQPVRASSPSGLSWGEEMPAEENQYSFNGSYVEYFKNIFNAEFSEYQITCEEAKNYRATVFTFTKDGKKALVVELLSKSSDAKKLRRVCAEQGIPYLRYYHDYHGWWNTRSYVTERTRKALKG